MQKVTLQKVYMTDSLITFNFQFKEIDHQIVAFLLKYSYITVF